MRLIHKGCGGDITPYFHVEYNIGGLTEVGEDCVDFCPDDPCMPVDFEIVELECEKCNRQWDATDDTMSLDNLNPDFEIVEE